MNWSNRDQQQLLEGSEPLWLAIYFGFIAVCRPPCLKKIQWMTEGTTDEPDVYE